MMSAIPIANEVNQRLQQLETQTGQHPFVITQHYGRASQLAFYLKDKPTVYCASSLMGGRKTQYDLWRHTDLTQAQNLLGKPAILLGATQEQWQHVFENVQPIGPLKGDHKQRPAFIGYNFRGFSTEN